jgi:hypothetical protein
MMGQSRLKAAGGCWAIGAVYLLIAGGNFLFFVSHATSRTDMTSMWHPTKLIVLAMLYLTTGILLGILARQILRLSSTQRVLVKGWSPVAVLLWAGGIGYLLMVYYPLPYYDHHTDKLFGVLILVLSWCIWLVFYPKGLDKVLESRSFYWLRVVLCNLLVFGVIGEGAMRMADPLLARNGLFSAKSNTPAGLVPHRPTLGSIRYTNSQGFEDRERTVERTFDAPRILMVGDSFVMGTGVGYDMTFTRLLEKALQEMNRRAEVINFGVGGYQPDEYLSLLKSHGIQYRPDLVLLAFYVGNDLLPAEGSVKIVAGQRYRVHINGNWIHDHLAWDRWYLFHNLRYVYRLGISRLRHVLGLPEWGFWDVINAWTSQIRPGKVTFSGYVRRIQSRGDQYLKENTPVFEYRWNRTQETLDKINRLLHFVGIPWYMLLLPAEEQVDQELQRVYLETIHASAERYDFEKPQRFLHAWGKANGVPIVDLTSVFRSKVGEGGILYLPNDGHWNESGHGLGAASILPVLRNSFDSNGRVVIRGLGGG